MGIKFGFGQYSRTFCRISTCRVLVYDSTGEHVIAFGPINMLDLSDPILEIPPIEEGDTDRDPEIEILDPALLEVGKAEQAEVQLALSEADRCQRRYGMRVAITTIMR